MTDTEMLERQLEYVLKYSQFYQKKLGNSSAFDLAENFSTIPFTTKQEILADQEQYPPYGSNRCTDIKKIRRIHKTSGTTQNPVIIALTDNDIKHIVQIGGKSFSECGLASYHTVMHCLNFNMWAGGLTDGLSLEATGAAVVPFGVGNTRGLIEMIRFLQADAIHCTPSYMSKIEQVLSDDFRMAPLELGLKLGLFGAESGLQNPVYRRCLEEKWGIEAYNANYGLSEVFSIIASECCHKRGLHFRAAEKLFVELIDPESGNPVPIEKGQKGEMVFTNLIKEAQPLIRYRSGDVVEILDTKCGCGADDFIFEVLGRSDDLLVIRGINVFASSIEKAISRWLDHLNGMYEILVSKSDPIDQIIIRAEKGAGIKMPDSELIAKIVADCKNILNISVGIQLVAGGTMERVEGKTRRLKREL